MFYLPLIIYVSCMYFKHNNLKCMFVTNTLLYHILCLEESAGYPFSQSSLWSALWPWGSIWRVLLVWEGILSCVKEDVQKRKCHPASVVQGHIMCTVPLQYSPKNRKRCSKKLHLNCIIFISAWKFRIGPQWPVLEAFLYCGWINILFFVLLEILVE